MIKLIKGTTVMTARDNNQAVAFLNNGWKKVEDKVDMSKYMAKPESSEPADTDSTAHTKTEINRLSTAELKDLATKENISDVESKNGGELKKELIEHFNL